MPRMHSLWTTHKAGVFHALFLPAHLGSGEGACLIVNPDKLSPDRRSLSAKYSYPKILSWADADHKETDSWPTGDSVPITSAPGETWLAVDLALRNGLRGLPGGSSLARLLAERRDVNNATNCPKLTVKKILAWADEHHRRHGRWPTRTSGNVDGQQETWAAIDKALGVGRRGLPGGSSLERVLASRRR